MFRRTLFVLSLAAATVIPAAAQSVTTFTVTNNAMLDFRFQDGALDPTLTLYRGQTYAFNVNTPGHPFFIATAGGSAAAPHFSAGVTNNDVTVGTLTFAVPSTAPATLFYQCGFHDAMSGTLLIQDTPTVPALGRIAMVALAGLVLVAGYLARRKKLDV